MFIYPNINPVAFQIGMFKIYWYGITYIIAFTIAWGLAIFRTKHCRDLWSKDLISDLIFYCAVGAVVGGRIGYTFIYNLPSFFANPFIIFKTWEGGMSFHGGLIGVLLALLLFAKKQQKKYWDLCDFLAPLVPLGLGAGRIGNFINGELYGRVTNVPWALVYPHVDLLPRHPSEVYEFFLEGIILFLIMWVYSIKPKPRMAVSAMFFLCYGVFRIIAEFFRQPDPQIGYILSSWLTMGQILSGIMVIAGVTLFIFAYRKHKLKI